MPKPLFLRQRQYHVRSLVFGDDFVPYCNLSIGPIPNSWDISIQCVYSAASKSMSLRCINSSYLPTNSPTEVAQISELYPEDPTQVRARLTYAVFASFSCYAHRFILLAGRNSSGLQLSRATSCSWDPADFSSDMRPRGRIPGVGVRTQFISLFGRPY